MPDAFEALTKTALSVWTGNNLDDVDYVLLLPHDAQDHERLNTLLRSAFAAKLGKRRGAIVEGRRADELLGLYSLYAFTDKLIIGSFSLPWGRKLRNLLDCGVATEDELINDVILAALNGT